MLIRIYGRSLDGRIEVRAEHGATEELAEEIESFHKYTASESKSFISFQFESIQEYLLLLEIAATELASLGAQTCFFLAAAVSDFYVPPELMSDHKIQSSSGLVLELSQVPKVLRKLTSVWAPSAFVVSFKLETDPSILLRKATGAIEKYGVDMVIANVLNTRRDAVRLVAPRNGLLHGCLPTEVSSAESNNLVDVCVITRSEGELSIDPKLVQRVISCHNQHIVQQG
jgi:phosphopantothenate-cysteine ligase